MEQFTVRSRGIPIGVSDLGLTRVDHKHRWGWFYPNEDGARVMAIVDAVLPLLHASARRDVRGGSDVIVLSLEVEGPELSPELTRALQDVETLDLTLHRADGTLIPTETIGIQDMEQLRALFGPTEAELEAADGDWAEGLDDETREAIERDVAALLDDAGFTKREPWMPEEEPEEMGRYQIHVRLISEWDVP